MKTLILILILIPIMAFGQATLEWNNSPGGVSISTDNLNNVYTTWWDYNPAGDIYLDKRDAAGNLLWEVKYDNTDNTRHEVATLVGCDNNDDIVVSGTIRSGYASPVNAASVLMKFDGDGNLLWRVVYENSFDGSSTKKVLIDADNNIYVLGMGIIPIVGGWVTKVKKFDENGNPLWDYYNTSGIGAATNMKFAQDGNIVISGRGIVGSINGYCKLDTAGNELFSAIGYYSLTVGDIAGDAAGNSYLINGVYGVGSEGSVLTKLDPAGNTIWVDTNTITATKVEVGTDQHPVVAGFPSTGSFGVSMIKYNMDGTIVWENFDADGPGYALMLHAGMQMDPANNIYFIAGTLFQMAVCRVDADGSYNYTATASGGGYAYWCDFSPDYGSMYMVGGQVAKFNQEPIIICEAPIGLYTNNITTTKARVNWTVEPGAMQYEVWYKKATAINWKKKFVPGINNKLNLKNLTCNTNYVWKIRTVCDTVGVDVKSDFSGEQFFTTAACKESESVYSTADLMMYPNPAHTQTTVQLPASGDWEITLLDLQGKCIYTVHTSERVITISLTDIPSGMYILRAHCELEKYSQSLIVQH